MRRRTTGWLVSLVMILTLSTLGCGSQDGEGVVHVCQKVGERGEDLSGGRHSKLATSWQALRGSAGDGALDSRVALRLSWDKGLTDADIQVRLTTPGVIKLQGTIASPLQRSRAIELAQSTQGVKDVVDVLEIKAISP